MLAEWVWPELSLWKGLSVVYRKVFIWLWALNPDRIGRFHRLAGSEFKTDGAKKVRLRGSTVQLLIIPLSLSHPSTLPVQDTRLEDAFVMKFYVLVQPAASAWKHIPLTLKARCHLGLHWFHILFCTNIKSDPSSHFMLTAWHICKICFRMWTNTTEKRVGMCVKAGFVEEDGWMHVDVKQINAA